MKALTIWQPWAALIVLGYKPYEYRRWPAPMTIVGQRIVIHASKRPLRTLELSDVIEEWRAEDGRNGEPVDGRDVVKGAALLDRIWNAKPDRHAPVSPIWRGSVPEIVFGAGIGTAILGKPQRVTELFATTDANPSRLDPDMWAWPLSAIDRWAVPVPMRGEQGLWDWREARVA